MHKLNLLILFALISGSGVAEANETFSTQNATLNELDSWESVIEQIKPNCTKGREFEDIEPFEAVFVTHCITRLVYDEILPIAVSPRLLKKLRKSALKNAKAYEKGKISKREYIDAGQGNWESYLEQLNKELNKPSFFNQDL